jgi:hypothetical protein
VEGVEELMVGDVVLAISSMVEAAVRALQVEVEEVLMVMLAVVLVGAQTKVEGVEVGDEKGVVEAEVQTLVGVGLFQTFSSREMRTLLAREVTCLM